MQYGQEDTEQTPKRVLESLFNSVDGLKDKIRVNKYGKVWICTENNLWEVAGNTMIQMLLSDLTNDLELDEDVLEWLECPSKLAKLAKAVVLIRCIRDTTFESRLKSSRSMLVVGGNVVDFKNGKPFIRPLQSDDYIESHSRILRWQFDPLEAQNYRNDVLQYFKKVFPIQEELDVYLQFMALTLNGSPCKAFGLGVDDPSRTGDNGKTKLIEFNSMTLKSLEKQNGWLVCSKKETQSMDGHNAGLKQLENVRLLQIDELGKNMKWNDGAFTKWLCGGSRAVANGRGPGSGKEFEFEVMTKVFITANMSSIPDCSNLDPAFIRRMLVFPFRSKFGEEEDPSRHLFHKQTDLSEKFILWRSAYLQLLMDSYRGDFDPKKVPQSMHDWKAKVLAPKDATYEELVKRFKSCGCNVDFCKIHILKMVDLYAHPLVADHVMHSDIEKARLRDRFIIPWAQANNDCYRGRTSIKVSGMKQNIVNALIGVVMNENVS